MCNYCFSENIYGFNSQMDFEVIRNQIEEKQQQGVLIYVGGFGGEIKPLIKIGRFGIGGKTRPSYRLYTCTKCNINWKLSVPENALRGFLIKEDK